MVGIVKFGGEEGLKTMLVTWSAMARWYQHLKA